MAKKIEQFEDLGIWKTATDIAIEIYNLSDTGKLKTDWGMKDQIRKAASSISNNISEGFEYNNNKHFIRFLYYSKGSAGEVRNQLYILKGAEMITKEQYENMAQRLLDLSRSISNFIKYLKSFEKDKS